MSNMNDPVVIVSAARTPMGAFQGELAGWSATQLGAHAISAAVSRAGLQPQQLDGALMGCVLPAGLGQAPARQAALGAGLPASVPAMTVSKVCGSGMAAVMTAVDQLRAGSADLLVAGGMESMSNAPYLLPKARGGYRIGHGQLMDHMMLDGLEDAYITGPGGARRSMGTFAEDCARQYDFTREQQDEYAVASLTRAQAASAQGHFADEIAPLTAQSRSGPREVRVDECPQRARVEKIPTLKPAFRPDGTITAASSSAISDGAAALVLTRASTAQALGLPILAQVAGHATHAQAPELFTTAPVFAIRKLLDKLGWSLADVGLFEINEAFAVVPMVAMVELGIDHATLNVDGGACALGHPIGASGARVLVTLLHAMRRRGVSCGIASLCIGGGEATAVALQAWGTR